MLENVEMPKEGDNKEFSFKAHLSGDVSAHPRDFKGYGEVNGLGEGGTGMIKEGGTGMIKITLNRTGMINVTLKHVLAT